MSECRLISPSLIPLSANGTASKLFCLCMQDTLQTQPLTICKQAVINTYNSAK